VLGIHPHHVDEWNNDVLSWMKDRIEDKKLIAIGETGLDNFRNAHSPLLQEKVLRAQIELAIAYEKPVVLHVRDVFDGIRRILDDYHGLRFVMHCFTGSSDDATWIIEKGGYISLSGIVTFTSARDLQRVSLIIACWLRLMLHFWHHKITEAKDASLVLLLRLFERLLS
jgi:TatD DNase family protein